MADNVTTQSATPATIPASTPLATREVTYSGTAGQHIAPVGIVAFSGSDDAKTVVDMTGDATNGFDVDVTRIADTAQTAQSIAATSGNAVTVSTLNGYSAAAVQITGTWTGTVTFEGSVDGGTTYFVVNAVVWLTGVSVTTATANGQWQTNIAGLSHFRVRCSVTGTGTIVISIRASVGAGVVGLDNPLPAGTAIIGALTANQSVNAAQINGVTPLMGNGASGTGAQRVTLASDSTGNIATIGTSITPGTAAANLGKAEDAAAASGDTGVAVLAVRRDTPSSDIGAAGDYATLQVNATGSLWVVPTSAVLDNAGFTDATTPVGMAGFIFDETAGTALTENDAGAARMDSKRAQVFTLEDETTRGQRATVNASKGLAVTPVPHTAGGLTISTLLSAATTNATSVKASAGQVFGWFLSNSNAAARYFKLYNKASAPTVGTDVPVMTIYLPAGAAANVEFSHGIAFATGIAFAITTGATTADTGAVAANEIIVNLLYK